MKTKLLVRLFERETKWIDLCQTHSFDLLPKITINVTEKTLTELYTGWLFWEIRYNASIVIGNTCCLKRK